MNPLQEHEHEYQPCQLCSIATRRKVFYRSDQPPACTCWTCNKSRHPYAVGTDIKYLFVGEAPGPSESVTHHPFTGTAGKIFDALVSNTNLSQWGITNTILCFPSQKDRPSKFRPPTKEEITNCQPRLNDLLEVVNAKYYIALGKVAKTNPPTGITFHLELDHPSYINRRGGIKSVEFKRNVHKLRKFLESEQ